MHLELAGNLIMPKNTQVANCVLILIRACLSSSHPMEELAVGETVTPIVVFICKKLVCSNPPENVRHV